MANDSFDKGFASDDYRLDRLRQRWEDKGSEIMTELEYIEIQKELEALKKAKDILKYLLRKRSEAISDCYSVNQDIGWNPIGTSYKRYEWYANGYHTFCLLWKKEINRSGDKDGA